MERNRDAAAVGVAKMPVTAFLAHQLEAVDLQCGYDLAGRDRAQPGGFSRHTLTATTGSSVTVTLGGSASPSS